MFGAMHMRCLIKHFALLIALYAISSASFAGPDQLLRYSQQLSELPGVSGYEEPIRQYVIRNLKSIPGHHKVDGMGNVLFYYGEFNPNRKTVLLMAHMDEVGFVVKEIDDQGFIRVIPVGGWATHVVWEQPWLIQTNKSPVPAVSGMDSLHVVADYRNVPKVSMDQFFLDTGLSREELLAKGVHPGVSVVPDFTFKKLGHYYQGKALDDRLGVAILLNLAKRFASETKPNHSRLNIAFAFTTQEELGTRGSKIISERIKPDVVLNLDSGIAHDYPMQFTQSKGPKLGGGPTLFIFDGSMMPNHSLIEFLSETAIQSKIPFQWESEISYSQDGASVQQSGQGSAVVNIGIPTRYVHSHAGVFDYQDLKYTQDLLWAGVQQLPKYFQEKLNKEKE